MLLDAYNRKIDYLRISVTDRCNLRCIYCMPEYGILQKSPFEILTFEEITKVARLALSLGINKIKITGGEPLVRKHLPRLIHLLSSLNGLKDLSLTTNAILLEKYAKELKKAGLKRMNVSIDSLDEQKFEKISRFKGLCEVLRGMDKALEEGFFIKLNVVIMKDINDDEVLEFVRFAQRKRIILRFIELMPNGIYGNQNFYISNEEIKERLRQLGRLKVIHNSTFGNGPAEYYEIEGVSSIVGFISPISDKFCLSCNRLRLTADGNLVPCLCSDIRFDLKGPLRQNREKDVLALIKDVVSFKSAGHNLDFSNYGIYHMSEIGG